jgi:hypothetical protein
MNPKKGNNGAVIGLTWKIPRSLNGKLLGYNVEWCKSTFRVISAAIHF